MLSALGGHSKTVIVLSQFASVRNQVRSNLILNLPEHRDCIPRRL